MSILGNDFQCAGPGAQGGDDADDFGGGVLRKMPGDFDPLRGIGGRHEVHAYFRAVPAHLDLVSQHAELAARGQGFVDGFGVNVDELVDVAGSVGQALYFHDDVLGKGAERSAGVEMEADRVLARVMALAYFVEGTIYVGGVGEVP